MQVDRDWCASRSETKNSVTYKADAGCMKFTLRTNSLMAKFCLMAKANPNKCVFEILYSEVTSIKHISEDYMTSSTRSPNNFYTRPDQSNESKVWVTWFNGVVCVGRANEANDERSIILEYDSNKKATKAREMIGFVKFYTMFDNFPCKWFYEAPQVNLKRFLPKKISSKGALRWEKIVNGKLPADALIGGFEKEAIYVARAMLTTIDAKLPGKYLPSEKTATFTFREHEMITNDFEVLCGYDAVWVRSEENVLPQNAYSGGTFERVNEPLYIGRATIDGHIICGKVDGNNVCFISYQGMEHSLKKYEVLVSCETMARGIEIPPEDTNADELGDRPVPNRRTFRSRDDLLPPFGIGFGQCRRLPGGLFA